MGLLKEVQKQLLYIEISRENFHCLLKIREIFSLESLSFTVSYLPYNCAICYTVLLTNKMTFKEEEKHNKFSLTRCFTAALANHLWQ